MDKIDTALDALRSMNPELRQYVLLKLIDEGTIKMAEAISAYSTYLENYKHDAQIDMQRLAESGILLGEKKIKEIRKMKEGSKRNVAMANAKTLLSKGFRETKYGKELEESIEGVPIDEDWYENCWGLKTLEEKHNG